LSPAWAAQAKPTKLQNAFEMGKQHLDALATAARSFESVGLGQCSGDIAGVLMQIARYVSHRCAGATPHLERADIAVGLGSVVAKCIVVHGSSRVQQLIVRADINVAFLIEDEVGPRESPVLSP